MLNNVKNLVVYGNTTKFPTLFNFEDLLHNNIDQTFAYTTNPTERSTTESDLESPVESHRALD